MSDREVDPHDVDDPPWQSYGGEDMLEPEDGCDECGVNYGAECREDCPTWGPEEDNDPEQ